MIINVFIMQRKPSWMNNILNFVAIGLLFLKVREQKGKHTDRQFFHNTISKFLTIGLSSARATSNKKYFSKSGRKKKKIF